MPIATKEEGEALRAPAGWRWHARPTYTGYRGDPFAPEYFRRGSLILATNPQTLRAADINDASVALYEWAVEHHMQISVADHRELSDDAVHLPLPNANQRMKFWRSVTARPRSIAYDARSLMMGGHVAMELGGETYPAGTTVDRDGNPLFCDNCGMVGNPLKDAEEFRVCHHCMGTCAWCDVPISSRFQGCAQHDPRQPCTGCAVVSSQNYLIEAGGSLYCETCAQNVCADCERCLPGQVERYSDPIDGVRVNICAACRQVRQQRPDDRIEQYDENAEMTVDQLRLEHTDFRPVRLCSIEMETADGGINLAPLLHDAGLSAYNQRVEYHRGGGGGFCYVERDASLGATGGELILDRVRLDDADDLNSLYSTLNIVRREVREGRVRMDMRCGLHIHVDAHQFGIHHVRNLTTVFNFLEDPLYRMSAARYMRHRGMQYAAKLNKGPFPDDRAFGLTFLNTNGHASALNVATNYWAAVRNQCRCGASVIGKYEQCECNLGKCTFEFRIYNGTVNPRKVHAYAALSQSMVSYARGIESIDADKFPASDFNANAPITTALKDSWFERLAWMFQDLYFAPNERESLMYVIRNCQLNELGTARLRELERMEYKPPLRIRKQVIQHRNLRTAGEEPRRRANPFGIPEVQPRGLRFNEILEDEEPF